MNFGNQHVGATQSRTLSLGNTGAADGYTEALDASFAAATGVVSGSGTITGLGAEQSNSTSLAISLSGAVAGVQSGSAVLDLASDGTGIDGLGTTALAAQTIVATGTLYNYATAGVIAATPLSFGNQHVGALLNQRVSITNIGAADGYTEALAARVAGTTGAASAMGVVFGLAAGGSSDILVGLNSGAAGVQTGTVTVQLASDGSGIDGLGLTGLGTQTIVTTGTLFNCATASAIAPVSFGNRHVGDTLSPSVRSSAPGRSPGWRPARPTRLA